MPHEYPYEYARVSAMRAALLRKEDYDRLAKVAPVEMAKLLEDRGYREVAELASSLSGAELVEAASALHHARVADRVAALCSGRLKELVESFTLNLRIERIKRGLRSAYRMQEPVQEAVSRQKAIPLKELRAGLERFGKTGLLSEIENAMDSYYYGKLNSLHTLSEEARELFREMAAAAVCRVVVKAGQEGLSMPPLRFMPRSLRSIAQLPADEAVKAVAARYGIPREEFSGLRFEQAAARRKWALARKMWKPLSADAVISLLVMQEIEAGNIRALLKAGDFPGTLPGGTVIAA